MLCFQRLSTPVAFSFFSSNRIQDHEGLFAWPVIQLEGCHHVYDFALDACQQRQGGGKS